MVVPLARTWFKVFLGGVILLLFVWTKMGNLDMKESGEAPIISRLKQPLSILFANNEGNKTQGRVNISTSTMPIKETTQTLDSSSSSESSTQEQKYFTNESQNDENVPVKEDVVDEDFLREREKVYRERRERVNETCKQLGTVVTYSYPKNLPFSRFRWLNSRKLIMCFNAKVGTSSWSQYLMEAARPGTLNKTKNLHNVARTFLIPPDQYYYRPIKLMKNYTKIMIVRHPFARVVSAYLDKIVGRKYPGLSKRIIKLHRPPSSSLTSRIPTFEEFVKYLLRDIPIADTIEKKFHGTENIHWMPFYANCAPCDIHYDVILNMETIDEDTRYVNDRFHLGLKEQLRKNHKAPNSSESSAQTLFKEVPRYLIQKLYERYRVDFSMFGYTIDPFIADT